MKTKTVKIDMIDLSVKLYIGTKEEIDKHLHKERSNFKGIGYGLTKKSKISYEIFIRNDQKVHSVTSILVHEITHVVKRALTVLGADEESEFRAHLTGHLFEEFEKFLNKLNNEKR